MVPFGIAGSPFLEHAALEGAVRELRSDPGVRRDWRCGQYMRR
jgi:hypothetical protein